MRETCFIGTPIKDAPPGASIAILPFALGTFPSLRVSDAVRRGETIRKSFNQATPYANLEEQCPMCRQAVCKEISETGEGRKMSCK